MRSFATIAAIAASAAATGVDIAWESLGHFKVKNPAFPNIGKYDDSDEFLVVSSFGAMHEGYIYIVPDIKDAVTGDDATHLKSHKLGYNFAWPNDI